MKNETITIINCAGEKLTGLIAGNEPGIGITIVDQDNPDNVLVCVQGRMSPEYENLSSDFQDMHNRHYEIISAMIKRGKIIFNKLDRIDGGYNPTIDECPFNQ